MMMIEFKKFYLKMFIVSQILLMNNALKEIIKYIEQI